MPIDPRKLKPTQLVQLLNSTPLGEVASERTLYRHRARAGLRIGDGRHVDLLRYVAWLVLERHRPRPEPDGLTGYEAHKERAAQRVRELSLAGRDIGELPAAANAERKEKAERDFRFFCEQYFPQTFHLPWSPDHLKVIAKIEQVVLEGGLFAMAMPRGSGKTSLCETACACSHPSRRRRRARSRAVRPPRIRPERQETGGRSANGHKATVGLAHLACIRSSLSSSRHSRARAHVEGQDPHSTARPALGIRASPC